MRPGCRGEEAIKPYAKIVHTRFVDIDVLEKQLGDCNGAVFYHLAWAGSNGKLKGDYRAQADNIRLALDMASAAKNTGCALFVCAGTLAEYAVQSFGGVRHIGGGLLYAAAKAALKMLLEAHCKNMDLPFVWARLANVYGSEDKTSNLISYTTSCLLRGETAAFGPALQPIDFIHIDDLTEALYRIGQKAESLARQEYFVGSGSPRPLKDYLLSIATLMGKPQLIKLGVRPDDGMRYASAMFDTSGLVQDIGEYAEMPFVRLSLGQSQVLRTCFPPTATQLAQSFGSRCLL